jgi:hypothetical protein
METCFDRMKFVGLCEWRKQIEGLSKKKLMLTIIDQYKKTLGIFLSKHEDVLRKMELEGKDISQKKLISITLETHYKKRTLVMNNLYWALRTIQANEMNGGKKGPGMVTKEKLHDDYLQVYGEREIIKTQRKNLNRYRAKGKVEFIIIDQQKISVENFLKNYNISNNKYITIQRIIGTSEMSTKAFSEVIDQVFREIWESGVNEPGDIHKYWVDFRNHLNKQEIILHDEKMTKGQYREKNKICEGCGVKSGVQIAHIKAIGMGGHEEPEKDHPLNWFCLCNDCHNVIIHGIDGGIEVFKEKFPHLSYKIDLAFKHNSMKIAEENKKPKQGELL